MPSRLRAGSPRDDILRSADLTIKSLKDDSGERTMSNTSRSAALFDEAQRHIPGGVNSPVRAFRGVGGVPRFIDRGAGAYLYDVDGNRYVDYVLSWGPLILGHAHADIVAAVAEQA